MSWVVAAANVRFPLWPGAGDFLPLHSISRWGMGHSVGIPAGPGTVQSVPWYVRFRRVHPRMTASNASQYLPVGISYCQTQHCQALGPFWLHCFALLCPAPRSSSRMGTWARTSSPPCGQQTARAPHDLLENENPHTVASIPLVSITVPWNPVALLTLLPDLILGHIWNGYFFR